MDIAAIENKFNYLNRIVFRFTNIKKGQKKRYYN